MSILSLHWALFEMARSQSGNDAKKRGGKKNLLYRQSVYRHVQESLSLYRKQFMSNRKDLFSILFRYIRLEGKKECIECKGLDFILFAFLQVYILFNYIFPTSPYPQGTICLTVWVRNWINTDTVSCGYISKI